MKYVSLTLFIGIMLSMSAFSFGGGGVDVGNHNQKGNFSLPDFKSEPEMVQYLESIMPKIESGEAPEVRRLLYFRNCSKTDVEFDHVSVTPSYRYNREAKKLEKEISGEVTVTFKNCRRER